MEGEVLEVQHFIPSLQKTSRQFGFIFAYDAPKIWNELPDAESLLFSQEPTHSRFYCIFLMVPVVLTCHFVQLDYY